MKTFIHAALLLAGLAFCTSCQEEKKKVSEPLRVIIETVTATDGMEKHHPYVGIIEAESSAMVSFIGTGLLKEVKVSEGQRVRKGQLIASIDDTQARNSIQAAEAMLTQAKDAEARMKQLHDNKSLPDMKWIEVQSKVQQAEATFEMAKKNLADCSIYAPCDGVIGSKLMSVGETVLPSQPIATVLHINHVKVKLSIPEQEISNIDSRTSSTISVPALNNASFEGGIIEKGVEADALTHTYNARINVRNSDMKLLPGMVCQVVLKSHEEYSDKTVSLPVKAVQQAADKTYFVWIVQGKKSVRRPVQIGRTFANRILITEGLSEGEKVIVEGYQKVSENCDIVF